MAQVTKQIISPVFVTEAGDSYIALDGKAFLVGENTITEAEITTAPGEFRSLVLALNNFTLTNEGLTWFNGINRIKFVRESNNFFVNNSEVLAESLTNHLLASGIVNYTNKAKIQLFEYAAQNINNFVSLDFAQKIEEGNVKCYVMKLNEDFYVYRMNEANKIYKFGKLDANAVFDYVKEQTGYEITDMTQELLEGARKEAAEKLNKINLLEQMIAFLKDQRGIIAEADKSIQEIKEADTLINSEIKRLEEEVEAIKNGIEETEATEEVTAKEGEVTEQKVDEDNVQDLDMEDMNPKMAQQLLNMASKQYKNEFQGSYTIDKGNKKMRFDTYSALLAMVKQKDAGPYGPSYGINIGGNNELEDFEGNVLGKLNDKSLSSAITSVAKAMKIAAKNSNESFDIELTIEETEVIEQKVDEGCECGQPNCNCSENATNEEAGDEAGVEAEDIKKDTKDITTPNKKEEADDSAPSDEGEEGAKEVVKENRKSFDELLQIAEDAASDIEADLNDLGEVEKAEEDQEELEASYNESEATSEEEIVDRQDGYVPGTLKYKTEEYAEGTAVQIDAEAYTTSGQDESITVFANDKPIKVNKRDVELADGETV